MSDDREAEAQAMHRAARIERERIAQSNHVAGIVQDSTEHWVVLHDRFAIANALYDAGYRLVGDLADLRALVEEHERIEAHNDTVPLNLLSDIQQEPRASQYRAVLDGLLPDH
ncbi:hypothetical protein SEA_PIPERSANSNOM_91 [Microbacterium phage PiperSansNom]|uniref:Uncharacterized protein n=1 Tax=Microbacterium phage PiperSansNom TaxID=2590937 RepID=A0A516KUY1_9CAUD|nr:hypothetical protein SEA_PIPERSANSNOM_91 [Microbacterium phage PiperSansNom]